MELTPEEFEEHLTEQLQFLKASAESFDNGFEGEIKRLAVSVRILMHDTRQSTSLLAHLGRKDIVFLDTATPFDERNQMSHSGLTIMSLGGPKGNIPLAPLDGSISRSFACFDDWWNGIVFVDQSRNQFSRKDIVLSLADKEGGAHVDGALETKWADLRKNNALGWYSVMADGREVPGEDQVPPTMRQIAHEVIRTLEPGYPGKKQVTTGGVIMHGASLVKGSTPFPLPAKNSQKGKVDFGRKIGRNEPCPCGSGKKYKRCHGC